MPDRMMPVNASLNRAALFPCALAENLEEARGTRPSRRSERDLILTYARAQLIELRKALLALDDALARLLRTTREPALGQMRLAWWRGRWRSWTMRRPSRKPVLKALETEVLPHGVTGVSLVPIVHGWEVLIGRGPHADAMRRFGEGRGAIVHRGRGPARQQARSTGRGRAGMGARRPGRQSSSGRGKRRGPGSRPAVARCRHRCPLEPSGAGVGRSRASGKELDQPKRQTGRRALASRAAAHSIASLDCPRPCRRVGFRIL